MRFFFLVLSSVLIAAFVPAIAQAAPTSSILLKADVVDYYSNRFILTADGGVRAQLSDGTVVSGNAFSMDLKLNRFLIAGDVHIDGPAVHEHGAAFAGYPDLDRNYFITEGDTPDRWTYFGLDWKDHHLGREQPGDAFYFQDVSGERPYIVTNAATIFPKNNVEFPVGARISLLGVQLPTPGYVVNNSSNPNFYQNAFSGATFDVGVPYHGSAESLSAFHLRYDSYRHFYTAFDQHFVHNADYAVFSVNPLTQNQRQWNFIGYKRESPAFESRLFYQLSTLSGGAFSEPSDASSFAQLQFNSRLGRYAAQLTINQFNNSLIPTTNNGITTYGLRVDGHNFETQLAVQSFENEIRGMRSFIPIKFQYRAGYGWAHDGFGITTINGTTMWGGTAYPTIYQTFVGATVYTPSIKLYRQTSISFKTDKQRQWFSLPHHIDTTNSTLTLANTPQSPKLPATLLSYTVLNVGDYYGKDQLLAYPAASDIAVTPFGTYTGQAAFRGFATSRNYTGAVTYTPTQYFGLNLQLQRFYVTPAPVAGLGGAPPWVFTGDLRVRLARTVLVDLTRTYYFNFGNQRWTPQFQIQFSP